ncbi:importin beta-1 subunit [Grosmannia clavigera kw1407]|uniref:Importin-95 n=1 Tax=Grosmannia clavigera (strain kw1407 / UAMH 11150) TaxID=655863 RepID=F0XGD6_GROCL|nr:importin beta-1 subunit [Grosmannia clavigera kw1407]EFX03096.1 importin beta-1 subunit [Grosmannia clavigera kw1407]
MEGNSDINTILTNSLSPDNTLRQHAEQQLEQAAVTNFSLYLATLVQELAKEDAQGHIRAAAGLALKNAFTGRDPARQADLQAKWLHQTDQETKTNIKQLALQTLSSTNAQAGQASAQVVASIASIELPRNLWPELMPSLVQGSQDPELRTSLIGFSNSILTAVVQGARKEETNNDVRFAAITALSDSLEFVGNNFKHEGERNYIMQVVCEATQAPDSRIQQGAFGCLNRIMALYYDNMRFYMEKALFGLTIMGMKSEDEDVAKLAVEFWSTVCEEEIAIEDDNAQIGPIDDQDQLRPFYNFARVATSEVVPVLLLLLSKQDEDAADDEYNISRAAYQCLTLYAQAVGPTIIPHVIQFVESHLRHEDWHLRDAAVSAFGAIMEGPDEKVLEPIVQSALAILISMIDDPSIQVRDSTAFTLGRITENCSQAIDPAVHLDPLIEALFRGLLSNPKMAASCCWALMNLAERFAGEPGASTNPLTRHFTTSVRHLLTVTAPDAGAEPAVRTAAYEVLNTFVTNSAQDSLQDIGSLSDVVLKRLEETAPLQTQVVSVEDKITLEDMQTSLCTVLQAVVGRLDKEIAPQGDRIMAGLLQILSNSGGKSSVPEAVFAAISSLANALEDDFVKYMDAFSPYLFKALDNQEEPSLCSMAIGLVSDITRSMGIRSQPWCDNFMNLLLNNLRSTTLSNQFKPAILQCFGDIAGAIGGHFETYLSVVAQVLQQAATVSAGTDGSYEMYDYVVSLREGIMDAWGGIIGAMTSSQKTAILQPYVQSIFQLLNVISSDGNRSEALMRSSMGVIGDLASAYSKGELSEAFRQDWVLRLIKETRTNREYAQRTIDTAKWARELVKNQIGGTTNVIQT